jgi:hypothetical protein
MGVYGDIPAIINTLCFRGIAVTLIDHYSQVMMIGCPNHFNATTTQENDLLYWRMGNHPSIKAKINQVISTMNKEEQNNCVIHISHWL